MIQGILIGAMVGGGFGAIVNLLKGERVSSKKLEKEPEKVIDIPEEKLEDLIKPVIVPDKTTKEEE